MVSYECDIVWYGNKGTDAGVSVVDYIDFSVKRGLDTKGNTSSITLKNKLNVKNNDGTASYEYTTDSNELVFQQEDVIKVYFKEATSNDDIIDYTDDSLDLLTTATVQEFSTVFDNKHTRLKISAIDKTYDMLSNLWANAYTDTDNKTAPEIIQEVVRAISDGINGQGFDDSGNLLSYGLYGIDARLFSDSIVDSGTTSSTATNKLIQSGQNFSSTVEKGDLVRNTSGTTDVYATVINVDSDTQLTLSRDIMSSGDSYQISNGFIQDSRIDGTSFPVKSLSKVWKPCYEWLQDLSDTQYTNTTTEVDDNEPVQNRNMVFYIDEKNRLHWFYPDDDSDYDITTGTTEDIPIVSMKMTKKTYDTINMVIFNGGKELESLGTLNYYFNENTNLKQLKMKYYPMTDIADNLREQELDNGGISSINADGTVTLTSSYNYTTSWGETVTSDASYKLAFRTKVINECKAKAKSLTQKTANPRWAKGITTRFFNFIPGELLKINSREYGMSDVLVRVNDVTHQVNKGQVRTSLTVEEDEPKIGIET